MKPDKNRVKGIAYLAGETVTSLAAYCSDRLGRTVTVSEVSKCIRLERPYPTLRELIAEKIGKPVAELFPSSSPPKRKAA